MALERQFQPLVDQEPNTPATWLYLRQMRAEVYPSLVEVLEYETDQLTDALLAGEYAKTLTKRVWGEEARLKDHMEETLPNPEELVNVMIQGSPVFGG